MNGFLALERYFFWFVAYSVVGWIYECIVESVRQKKIVNRGFLNGPYCPIYGAGALIDAAVLGWIENPITLFFVSAILCCTMEYLTSVIMEKMFHARWWDYYDFKFNLDGRICLLGFLAFGTLSVLLVKFIHPFTVRLTDQMPFPLFHVVCFGLLIIISIDAAMTVHGLTGFDAKFAELAASLSKIKSGLSSKVQSTAAYEKINGAYVRFSKSLSDQQIRLIHSFPRFSFSKHKKISEEFKKFLKRDKNGESSADTEK